VIEGYVWLDQNRDRQRQPDEAGIPGVVVYLQAGVSALNFPWGFRATEGRETTTDSAGFYQFEKVLPGVYRLRVTDPAGHWPTTETQVNTSVNANQTVLINFGFYRPPAIRYLPLVLRR
jgi:hypothetical protein